MHAFNIFFTLLAILTIPSINAETVIENNGHQSKSQETETLASPYLVATIRCLTIASSLYWISYKCSKSWIEVFLAMGANNSDHEKNNIEFKFKTLPVILVWTLPMAAWAHYATHENLEQFCSILERKLFAQKGKPSVSN
jgi:hypothetical protein